MERGNQSCLFHTMTTLFAYMTFPRMNFSTQSLNWSSKLFFWGAGGASFPSIEHREEYVCLVLHSIAVSYTQLRNDPFSNFCFQVFRKRAALFKGGSKSSSCGTRWSGVFWRQLWDSQGLAMDRSPIGSRWRLTNGTKI
jgi:hypothetical protein